MKLHQTNRCPYGRKILQYKINVTNVGEEKSTCGRIIPKNKVNKNINLLIEFCKLHYLLITTTIFKHKPSHHTTWISPLSPVYPRKNPQQNQIDYILLRKNMNSRIFHSRSFNSNITKSDNKPVIAKIHIKWMYTKNATGITSFNLCKLQKTKIAILN